ncbi:MAG: MarC family protein [Candidatus Diapherotrites archaeon]|nr:MarC family protein [Candidatus Diapherotrites archaeon]
MIGILGNELQLIILFFVIFDPLASLVVFFTATKSMPVEEKKKIAALAITVASCISAVFLIAGESVLYLFNTNINEFRIAGGIILAILGVKMALGQSLTDPDSIKDKPSRAIAAIIGTPLITGPAAITSIIISTHDYGFLPTAIAVITVMLLTAAMFYNVSNHASIAEKNQTLIKVLSTILGLITLAWGVNFIRVGLGF